MGSYNIALLGFGYWGKILYRYLREHPHFKIKRIATRHPDKITIYLPPEIKKCKPDEAIEDEEIDAIVVATPIVTHYEYIKKSLQNKKNIFAEKPTTLKYNEAVALKKLSEEQDRILFTDYIFTFSPSVQKMVQMIKEGRIGNIRSMIFQVRQLGHFSDDVYWDLGSHILSIVDLLYPLDKLKFRKKDMIQRDGVTETGIINFSDPRHNNFTGAILLSFNHPQKERNMAIYGNGGTLVFDMARETPLSACNYKVDREKTRNPINRKDEYFEFDEHNTVKNVINGFYQCLAGRKETNIDSAIRITRVLEELDTE
ncbi:MAG: Gfo/Idh/MocA family protein [Vulcanimicrobiota bacterium]